MQQQQSFDMSQPTPRVNASQMGRFVGKRVKLVGQVAGVNGSSLTLKAADEAMVEVQLKGTAPTDQFVEFEGMVESPTVLREESQTSFGGNFGERSGTTSIDAICC
jgi:hypothetical protein